MQRIILLTFMAISWAFCAEDATATGKLNGKEWVAVESRIDTRMPADEKTWTVAVYAEKLPKDEFVSKQPSLSLVVPRVVGKYNLGKGSSATMHTPPSENEQAEEGTIEVVEVGKEQVKVKVELKINENSHVTGIVTFKL